MPDQEDRKITLDIFDIADMLTDALQARGFWRRMSISAYMILSLR